MALPLSRAAAILAWSLAAAQDSDARRRRAAPPREDEPEECDEETFMWKVIVAGFAIVLVAVVTTVVYKWLRPKDPTDGLDGAADDASDSSDSEAEPLPKGMWRGYTIRTTPVQKPSCAARALAKFGLGSLPSEGGEFSTTSLDFGGARELSCRLRGEGSDDSGSYVIRGWLLSQGQKLTLRKRYLPAASGRRGGGNEWVKYTSRRVGRGLHQGFRGSWRSSMGDGGAFHIWPAMERWQEYRPPQPKGVVDYVQKAVKRGAPTLLSSTAAAPVAANALDKALPLLKREAPPPEVFAPQTDALCVLCKLRPIDCSLKPCGHAAVCCGCAGHCLASGCPICRLPVMAAKKHDGQEVAGTGDGPRKGLSMPDMPQFSP